MIKPEVDDREYSQFVLSNGIPVTVVSDKRFYIDVVLFACTV